MRSKLSYHGNLLQDIPQLLPQELLTTLLESPTLKIERIVSRGHHSAAEDWYDQPHNEWVLLLQGSAEMALANQTHAIDLRPGDHLLLPAHCKHRVVSTPVDQDTIWLAIHF